MAVDAQAQQTPSVASEAVTPYATQYDPNTVRPATKRRPEGFSLEAVPTPLVTSPRHPAAPAVQLFGVMDFTGPTDLTVPILNFPGINRGGLPDTVGDVGPNHFVQMTNGTLVRVFDKTGATLTTINPLSSLWPATDPCGQSDVGDPIVVYDHLADRWLVSQFEAASFDANNNPVGPFHMCIAISQTPNPSAGTWFAYTFTVPVFPDYPKFGVWPDGYYMSSYEGGNLGIFVFNRAAMVTGAAATFMRTTIAQLPSSAGYRDTRILPADLDGPAPAFGTPDYFVRSVDSNQDTGNANDRIEIWEAAANWFTSTFTFTNVQNIGIGDGLAAFDTMTCDVTGNGGTNAFRDCINVPGTGTVDALSNRPMMQLRYRVLNGQGTLVFNQTIDVSGNLSTLPGLTTTHDHAGIRWYQLNRGANWSIAQQGTYAAQPIGITDEDQVLERWMGSAALDKVGNLAVAYSITDDDTVHPGLRYVGRLAGDLPNAMTQVERTLIAGTTSPSTEATRWGDYSALGVDPVDGCTFWFTSHVAGYATQIGSFRFASCNPVDLKITKSDSPDPVIAGNLLTYTIDVQNAGAATANNVVVTDTLPAGLVFQSSSPACSGGGQVKTCSLSRIAAGASKQLTIVARVPANLLSALGVATTVVTNTATVSANETDSNLEDNTASASTNVTEQADLQMLKVCKPDGPATAGGPAYCDLTVTNLGVSDAQNVRVDDALVSNSPFAVTGYTVPAGFACAPAPGPSVNNAFTVTCTSPILAAGASATIRVTVTSQVAGDVNDTARASASTPDPNTSNNTATGRVTFVASADLAIAKSATPNPVVAGNNLTYTITISNAGPSPANNVVVTDTIPGQTSVVSVTPGAGFQCQGGIPGNPAQPLTCALGALASGASTNITVVVKVNASVPTGSILVNNASVSSAAPDPNNSNNVITAYAPVVAQADLAIVKTSDRAIYKPSTQVIYTITVTNNGVSDAQAVIVTDTLPDPKQALYQSDNGGCTLIAGKTLSCNLGAMATGTTRSFQVYMVVKGSRGSIDNTATVASPTTDPSPGNNSSTRTVTIGR
ncbi:MAG TPA: DUF11 domain-containing protein [Candidatus Polarisedimenticolaceae bacterium]|nr:DUF11 domain-containing protein [Candidatus Polarisedimenticolaceae bacterium]